MMGYSFSFLHEIPGLTRWLAMDDNSYSHSFSVFWRIDDWILLVTGLCDIILAFPRKMCIARG